MISVRNVCACSSLAGCLWALMVSVPSGPREEVTEVGSTSSGSWHLWVKVFIIVPSVASCETKYRHVERYKMFILNFILRYKVSAWSFCTYDSVLLWKVQNGHPKHVHFPKTVYAQVSLLFNRIISPRYCRILPKNCCCNHKYSPGCNPELLFTIFWYWTHFSTASLYSSPTSHCNDL